MRDKHTIKRELKKSKAIEECACRFGIVGDPTRMKICWLLHHYPKLTVSEIAKLVGVSVSAVSHSLKKLKENRLVRSDKKHRQVFYRLADTDFNQIIKQSLPKLW